MNSKLSKVLKKQKKILSGFVIIYKDLVRARVVNNKILRR